MAHHGHDKHHLSKSIIAGGIAGGVEVVITYPTEFVKTQMQLYPDLAKKGSIWLVKDTVQSRGFLGLYRGLGPLFYFAIPKSGVRFAAAEEVRGYFRDKYGKLNATQNFISGLVGGIAEAIFVVTPQETMKVRLIHDQLLPQPKFKGFLHGVSTIVKEQGLAGTYKGLIPTICRQGTNQAVRFGCFYKLKEMLLGNPLGDFNRQTFTGLCQSLGAGAAAGAVSVVCTMPIDVVKTKMQGLDAHAYGGVVDCIKQTWAADGLLGFFKGMGPRMSRVCFDVAIQMTVFDIVMDYLNRFWPAVDTAHAHAHTAKH